jgi:thiamine kinase
LVLLLGEKPISNKALSLAKHILKNWRQWQAPFQSEPQIVEQLEGGLTNTNYLIESGCERAVLRLNNPDAYKLGVDRQTEITILKQLQSTDLVPRVYYADSSILVSEYIDGCAIAAGKTLNSTIKQQIQLALDVIQKQDFTDLKVRSYEAYCRGYTSQLSASCLSASIKQKIFQIAQQIDTQDWSPVLCHHDLIPENIIQGANGLFIIDWEYASLGHPQFDYLRILNDEKTANILQFFQAIMDQLWYAIRYPQLQSKVQQKLINIIEKGS